MNSPRETISANPVFIKQYYTPKNDIYHQYSLNTFTERISASLQYCDIQNQQYELSNNRYLSKRNYFKLIESPNKKFEEINIGPWQQNQYIPRSNELGVKKSNRSLKKLIFGQKNIINENLSTIRKCKIHNQENFGKQGQKFLNTIVYNNTLINSDNNMLKKLKSHKNSAEKVKKMNRNWNDMQNKQPNHKPTLNYLEHIKQIITLNKKKISLRQKLEPKISKLMSETGTKRLNSYQIIYVKQPKQPYVHMKIKNKKKNNVEKFKCKAQKRFKSLQNQ